MSIFIVTLMLMGLTVAAMSIGVIVGGKRLRGSCGGPGASDCECTEVEQQTCKVKHLARRAEGGS